MPLGSEIGRRSKGYAETLFMLIRFEPVSRVRFERHRVYASRYLLTLIIFRGIVDRMTKDALALPLSQPEFHNEMKISSVRYSSSAIRLPSSDAISVSSVA